MQVLVVDIGGTKVKILATGQKTPRKLPSGGKLTPPLMVDGVKALAGNWKYDAVAIGFPGRVVEGRIVSNPRNLGRGSGAGAESRRRPDRREDPQRASRS